MSLPAGTAGSPGAISSAVEALARTDIAYLMENPSTPALGRSGVKYRHDHETRETWASIPEILEKGTADCKSLSAWRIAELRRLGYPAVPRVTNCKNSTFSLGCGSHYHISVLATIAGRAVLFDPSKELGM